MPNRLFYTAKFDSDYIIYCKSDIKANFFELFRAGNIISSGFPDVKNHKKTYKSYSRFK